MHKTRTASFQTGILLAAFAGTVHGQTATNETSIYEALDSGVFKTSLRYRYEYVKQGSQYDYRHNAHASTLRTRVNYTSGDYRGLSAFVEFDDVRRLSQQQTFSTEERPTVADYEYTEINQAYLKFTGAHGVTLTYGNQRILLDGQRHLGSVGWRQNEQTFDATRIDIKPLDTLTITGAYISARHHFAGTTYVKTSDADKTVTLANDIHPFYATLANLVYTGLPGKLSTYHISINRNVETTGMNYTGKTGPFSYELEWARQEKEDLGGMSEKFSDIDTHYAHAALKYTLGKVTLTAGQEILGSDNGKGNFATPLGTNHKFNGWADQYILGKNTSLPTGLVDNYGSISTKFGQLNAAIIYHNFAPHKSSVDNTIRSDMNYGHEWDAVVKTRVGKIGLMLKYAHYEHNHNIPVAGKDTEKAWLQLNMAF